MSGDDPNDNRPNENEQDNGNNQPGRAEDEDSRLSRILGWVFLVGLAAMVLSGVGFWLWGAVPQMIDLFRGGFVPKLGDRQHNLGAFLLCLLLAAVQLVPGLAAIRLLRRQGWPKPQPRTVRILHAITFVCAVPLFALLLVWFYTMWVGPASGGDRLFAIGRLGFYGGSMFGAALQGLGALVFSAVLALCPYAAMNAYVNRKEKTR